MPCATPPPPAPNARAGRALSMTGWPDTTDVTTSALAADAAPTSIALRSVLPPGIAPKHR